MGRRAAALPPELPAIFHVADALAIGVPSGRLERADLRRPHRGVRVQPPEPPSDAEGAAAPDQWREARDSHIRRMREYLPVIANRGYFCGLSAALLWGIPLPPWIRPGLVEVGVPRPQRAPRRPGIRGHQHSTGFVTVAECDGMPVTDPASTWATLGRLLSIDELIAAADHVLRIPRMPGGFRPVTERALASRDQLRTLTERKGRPGAPRLRVALELARTGSASPPETHIRLLIRDAHLPEPVLDHDVRDEFGRFLGCSELAYPERRVAIEYESDGHLLQQQLRRDIDKYQAYAEAGWIVVRLTSQLVYRAPSEAIRRIRHALSRRPSPPRTPTTPVYMANDPGIRRR